MVIRDEQLKTMADAQAASFVRRMVSHIMEGLVAEYQALGLQLQDAEAFVHRQIAAATRYGLHDARDLKVYIDCTVIFGPQFDTDPRYPWASAVLGRSDIEGGAKADVLHEHLIFSR